MPICRDLRSIYIGIRDYMDGRARGGERGRGGEGKGGGVGEGKGGGVGEGKGGGVGADTFMYLPIAQSCDINSM